MGGIGLRVTLVNYSFGLIKSARAQETSFFSVLPETWLHFTKESVRFDKVLLFFRSFPHWTRKPVSQTAWQ